MSIWPETTIFKRWARTEKHSYKRSKLHMDYVAEAIKYYLCHWTPDKNILLCQLFYFLKISQINTSFWNIKVIEHFFLARLCWIIASDIHLILHSFHSLTSMSCLKSQWSECQWQLAKHIYNTWHRANTSNLPKVHTNLKETMIESIQKSTKGRNM